MVNSCGSSFDELAYLFDFFNKTIYNNSNQFDLIFKLFPYLVPCDGCRSSSISYSKSIWKNIHKIKYKSYIDDYMVRLNTMVNEKINSKAYSFNYIPCKSLNSARFIKSFYATLFYILINKDVQQKGYIFFFILSKMLHDINKFIRLPTDIMIILDKLYTITKIINLYDNNDEYFKLIKDNNIKIIKCDNNSISRLIEIMRIHYNENWINKLILLEKCYF